MVKPFGLKIRLRHRDITMWFRTAGARELALEHLTSRDVYAEPTALDSWEYPEDAVLAPKML